MKIIDAKGIACPRPVIMTKKAINEENLEEVKVLVDNEIATENLSKMATQLGFVAEVITNSNTDYEVVLKKSADAKCEIMDMENNSEYIVVISSDRLGTGDEDFSKKLLDGFIYALREQDVYPKTIVCYNTGVKLTTVNEKTVEDLKYMNSKGVEVLSCGLCLENYNVKEQLKVGSATNMYRICELQRLYKTVKPC